MLSDRSYMRNDYARPTTSVLTWLICATVAGFIVQNVFWRWFGPNVGRGFDAALALTPDGLASGRIWTLLSYGMLHDMRRFLHIVFNMLGLFFIGRELLPLLGARKFLWLYGGGVVGGGVLWVAVNWGTNGQLVGASAGVLALFTLFAAMYPNRSMTFLFFFIPVTIKPKWALLIIGGIDLFGFLFNELGGRGLGGVAHSAHLGGIATGWLFFRYVHQREWNNPDQASPGIELPGWLKRNRRKAAATPHYKVNLSSPATAADSPSRDELRAEVDRILDKINSQGFGALSESEKKRLDEAKDLLSRR